MSITLPYLLASRYRLTRRLGEGSFAETFLATDTLLQRQVAVKILREQYARDPRFAAHFANEAQAAAAVSHPNVVEVYDSGREGETLFIVMEWVDGSNLKQMIREQAPLPVPEAIRLLLELLQGLAVIHQAGIVHRDVKPQNVLMTRHGSAKLTDFGIARGAVASGLTETGVVVGTAAYMAPEQASGKPVGPGVDLYAAGVILFELVTGRLPFPGENPVQVMYQQVHEAVPRPGELNRGVGVELEAVILRALAKEPGERYPTAEAMAEALAGVGSGEATRVVPAVAASDVERRVPDNRAYQDVPPAWPGQAAARSRGSLPRAAAWVVGILVAFSLAGLILFDPFPSGRDYPNVSETAQSNSPAVLSTTPSPSPSPSSAPSPTPEPSPTPSPTASPEDKPPAASPVPPSPSVEPSDAFPDPSAIETHLLERKDEIRSRIAEEIGDAQPKYSPAP